MNKKITNRQIALHVFTSLLLLTGVCSSALAQTNIALTATYVGHGDGATAPGTGAYGPQLYNDNVIPAYGTVAANEFTYVGSGGWI